MTLKLKATAKAAKFEYTDGSMDVSWTVDASLTDDELVDRLRRIVGFYDAQTGREALPERIPGMALGMAQTQHPPIAEAAPAMGNGWASVSPPAQPDLPEDRKSEWEFIPESERE